MGDRKFKNYDFHHACILYFEICEPRKRGFFCVVEGDGTGVVHLAPGFGEDDQVVCQEKDIELVCPVDNAGKFTSEISDFAGMQVFDANDPIIIKLKNQGNWIKTEQYIHNYPHCWRTDTPLIYKAVPSWYVRVSQFKDRMVKLNKKISFRFKVVISH